MVDGGLLGVLVGVGVVGRGRWIVWKETVVGTGPGAGATVGATGAVVLWAEDMRFTTWRLAPILRPKVRDEIRERRESSSSQEVVDGGSAIAKTTGDRKTELGSLTCWT
jgi:hypothetical protein